MMNDVLFPALMTANHEVFTANLYLNAIIEDSQSKISLTPLT